MTRLEELLSKMTLREKLAQMTQLGGDMFTGLGTAAITGPLSEFNLTEEDVRAAGSVLGTTGAKLVRAIQEDYLKTSRLGIPLLFMADVIHGFRTVFPIPLALGCTWDPELAGQTAVAAAREAASAGVNVTFSPMVDLVRDPRWGRVSETTGEDPYLNRLFAEAFVKGYQGENYAMEGTVASCVKHFAGYGGAEGGRDYNTVELSGSTLRDQYLPAYKAAVDAGCEMVMTSFNTLDGVPSTANEWLFRNLLRGEWGFKGVSISDWGAVHELTHHGVAEDDREAAQKAIRAGVDIEMMSYTYLNWAEELVAEGRLDETLIDEAVLRILTLKEKLGLFENPYRFADADKEASLLLCSEHRKLARDAAAASLVLLKNDGALLPLSGKGRIAVVGPYAEASHILGCWSGEGLDEEAVNLRAGLEAVFDKDCLRLAEGCSVCGANGDEALLDEAVEAMRDCDVIIAALGEHPSMSGEAGSRAALDLPGHQERLLDAAHATGKPVVVLLFTGRPLDIRSLMNKANALLLCWFPGTEGGTAIAETLAGKRDPSGRLAMSFPYSVGQCPVYYNHLNTGRPKPFEECTDRFVSMYLDIPNAPLLPFGYGLGYTCFKLTDMTASKTTLSFSDSIQFSATLHNVGTRAGIETVQFYVRDVSGSRARPVLELKGFQKVALQPGESRVISFVIGADELRFTTLSGEFAAEPGRFTALIGHNASSGLTTDFKLEA